MPPAVMDQPSPAMISVDGPMTMRHAGLNVRVAGLADAGDAAVLQAPMSALTMPQWSIISKRHKRAVDFHHPAVPITRRRKPIPADPQLDQLHFAYHTGSKRTAVPAGIFEVGTYGRIRGRSSARVGLGK